MLVENGDGFIRFEDENGDYFEGASVNHKTDGQWRGWHYNSNYTQNYTDDVFIQVERLFQTVAKRSICKTQKKLQHSTLVEVKS